MLPWKVVAASLQGPEARQKAANAYRVRLDHTSASL